MQATTTMNAIHAASLFDNEEEELQGHIQAFHLTGAFAYSMAVKAACLLGIPDILAKEGALTLEEIACRLSSRSCSMVATQDHLYRILMFLCCKGFFSLTKIDENSVSKYALTPVSKWLLQDSSSSSSSSSSRRNKHDPPCSLAPAILMLTNTASMAPWHHLSDYVLTDELPFEKAHGMDIWSFANQHPDFNKLFNDAMASTTDILMTSLLKHYHGFANIGTLVDVGGGVGIASARIAAHYPSIKAINLDLPYVVATATDYPGVEHVGGDMFNDIPSADATFIKVSSTSSLIYRADNLSTDQEAENNVSILVAKILNGARTWQGIMHDWDDEHCIKILKNCRKAISETGKVIIVECILEAEKEVSDPYNEAKLAMDLLMMVHTTGGKQRTQAQWEALLARAGFPRYNFLHLPLRLHSVIEAFTS